MDDFSKIKESLLNLYPFTEEQLWEFTNRLSRKKLKKKEFLLRQNQTSDFITFINRGSLRFYTKTEHGELTLHFFTENFWVADLESLLTQRPSENYIEALENSDIYTITLKNAHSLMDIYPCFRMLNSLLADFTISAQKLVTINVKSPDERYNELLSKHPDWLNRFPQMHIASYLGMAPETLSRVRARIV